MSTRSRALTAADTVLAASDRDEAAARLAPWTAAVPDTPDGFLGWVGDHTTPSPIVTRLVMAAHAPRRRLSRALDALDPLTSRLEEIPQVTAQGLFERYLSDMFTSRADTVRTFVSLCLARTHPEVTTWAAAAQRIGLDPDLGEKTAQACAVGQQASSSQVVKAIQDLAAQLPGQDFREREQDIRALAADSAWFTSWARRFRPRTPPSSSRYALTYLWVTSAHGHITTSPAWAGLPTREQRSQYRRFVHSLNTTQLTGLARLPGVGP